MRTIALLSDFGTRDPYVAAMKGVIASRTDARIADLTHEIAPFDVLEAAWFLRTVVAYWPSGTIFVAVVDPGVGTDRRIIAAESEERVFLAPDNGLLSLVVDDSPAGRRLDAGETPAARYFSVENERFFLPGGSHTFHGRDRFAPAAAAIANGVPVSDLGPHVAAIARLPYEPPVYGPDAVRGTIVSVDRFGNLITDIERSRVPFAAMELRAGDLVIDRLERTYALAEPGPFLIVGSSGRIEISVANGSAAERLQLRRLERVSLRALRLPT